MSISSPVYELILATTKRVRPTRIPKVVGNNLKKKLNTSTEKKINRPSSQSRPGDVNHWGREGEKYRPDMNSNSDIKTSQQQPDNVAGIPFPAILTYI